MLVFLSFSPFFALRGLWTNLDFLRHMTLRLNLWPTPMGQKVLALTWTRENVVSARWLLREQNWVRLLQLPLQWPMMARGRRIVQAPCGDARLSSLKSLWISDVSYTCNYLGIRLKYLHREQSFISRRAHFVSCDFSRALPSVIKQWWLIGGQVRKSWSDMLSPWPGVSNSRG